MIGNGCACGIRSDVSWKMAGTTGVRGLVILISPATATHPSYPSSLKRLNNALSTAVKPIVGAEDRDVLNLPLNLSGAQQHVVASDRSSNERSSIHQHFLDLVDSS